MVNFSLFLILSCELCSQAVDTLGDGYTITIIEQPPCFRVCENNKKDTYCCDESELNSFINNNLCYLQVNIKDTIRGKVFISFWINTDGKTYDHKVIRSLREDLDKESLRVARLIEFEKPAMQRGIPIRIRFVVAVEFELPANENTTKDIVKK